MDSERLGREVAALAERVRQPTDWDVTATRPCPDCGYEIGPGWQHGRHAQPEGASHVVCGLQRVLRWEHLDPPWPRPEEHEDGSSLCGRCDQYVSKYWRHFWPTCRACAVWSVAGQALMFAFGLDGHPWLYWGARPWCYDCNGVGFLPCQPQDMSIMRQSGACATCGAWSFKLFHATDENHGDVEGSARHYDDEADHEVVVTAAPLMTSIRQTFERADA